MIVHTLRSPVKRMLTDWPTTLIVSELQGAAKSNLLRFFAVFSAVAWNFKAKFYRHI